VKKRASGGSHVIRAWYEGPVAKSKTKARAGVKIPVPLLLLVLVVGGGLAWWWSNREVVEPGPTWSDTDVGTTPVEERLEVFRASWNAAALDEIRNMCIPPDENRVLLLDRRLAENHWEAGLPTVGTPISTRTGPERYTVEWPVEELENPIVTYWEWLDGRWQIASWKIPRVK
jgi:hypothetical protein